MVFCSAPLYFDEVQFGVTEGLVRVWFVRSVYLLPILGFGVSVY
jgi:hypothetical protein